MARSTYACQQCGAVHPRWVGKCESCGGWNSLVEEAASAPGGLKPKSGKRGPTLETTSLAGGAPEAPRRKTGVGELDRAFGGGLTVGSASLVGGDPGIGKSTLLLQALAWLSQSCSCLYVTGEEAVAQIRMRAARLGLSHAEIEVAASGDVRAIVGAMRGANSPNVVVVDSIQTMYLDNLDGAPGSVGQVRAATHELVRTAKQTGVSIILVGHVTKDGSIAGPRVMEHMVDTVLYFEGDRSHQFRILRAVKNRFGPADEIGVFEMHSVGLVEQPNPSALFLSENRDDLSGSAVYAGVEGARPMLLEVQALVAPSPLANPRRAVVGWDAARLNMLLAVLEARCGVSVAGQDVYLNVAGGLKVQDPAADMAVAAAILSSLKDAPLPAEAVYFGEIGLSGEARPVSHAELRLKEATKLGFKYAVGAAHKNRKQATGRDDNIVYKGVSRLSELVDIVAS